MATTRTPPNVVNGVATATEAGGLTINRGFYDFADKTYAGNLAAGDKLCIGLVPRGQKLVPHLSRIDMIAIDTNGAPTGDYSIGDDTTPTALKGSTASETAAAILSGEDFALATAEIGSNDADTPVYVVVINASATTPTTGKIQSWLVTRPWDSTYDTNA